jgi:paraquat-inducible protein B
MFPAMSKPASPRLIGAFVVVGVLLALVIVGFVGSFRAFNARQTFVVYFDSSVNNLNVGAKVKWKGVPVGQVSDIRIRWNQSELSTAVPVFVEIDLDRLGMELDDPEVLRQEVANGLRARMDLDSIISGMLYIELNYIPNAGAPVFIEKDPLTPEIPVVASPLDAIGDLVFKIAENVSNIDFKRISDNLNTSLENLNRVIADLDAAGMSRSIKSAANSVTSLAGSPKVLELLENANKTVAEFRTLAEDMSAVGKPLPGQISELSAQARKTMESIQLAADQLRTTSAENSEVVTSLNGALRELTAAARAANDLAGFLERNPNALISGRAVPVEGRK